jgi:hypothetical protein
MIIVVFHISTLVIPWIAIRNNSYVLFTILIFVRQLTLVIHEKPFTPQKLFYYISLIDLFLGLSIFALVILSFLLNKPFWIEKVEGKLYPIIGLSLTPFSFFLFLIIIAIYYQTFELFFAKQAMLG